eukprot:5837910-Prymnesium_polylepis.1
MCHRRAEPAVDRVATLVHEGECILCRGEFVRVTLERAAAQSSLRWLDVDVDDRFGHVDADVNEFVGHLRIARGHHFLRAGGCARMWLRVRSGFSHAV